MRKLLFIIVLFFSTSVLAVENELPCLESSDLTKKFGKPDYNVGPVFYWLTPNFTAVCAIEIGYKDGCFININLKQFEEDKQLQKLGRIVPNLYKKLTTYSEDPCQ